MNDVVKPGEYGHCKRSVINHRQIPRQQLKGVGREEKDDRYDLNERIQFAEYRGTKHAEPRGHIDDRRGQYDNHVTADRHRRQPERDRVGQSESRHRENDESRHEQQLIGHRIENRAELRLLIEASSDESVKPVGDGGREKDSQRPGKSLVVKNSDKNWYQYQS